MSTLFDKGREGREQQGASRQNLDTALKNWERASDKDKPRCALAVLSNIRAMNCTLDECITDVKKAQAIRDDASRV